MHGCKWYWRTQSIPLVEYNICQKTELTLWHFNTLQGTLGYLQRTHNGAARRNKWWKSFKSVPMKEILSVASLENVGGRWEAAMPRLITFMPLKENRCAHFLAQMGGLIWWNPFAGTSTSTVEAVEWRSCWAIMNLCFFFSYCVNVLFNFLINKK